MEARLVDHPLYSLYQQLSARFAVDLVEERDLLLSRAALLMLMQETPNDAA